jgi:hypothetical protein
LGQTWVRVSCNQFTNLKLEGSKGDREQAGRLEPMRLLIPAIVLGLCLPSLALHESQVGIIDWYKSLIGVPKTSSPLSSPIFHRVGEPNQPTQSVILTATESNVLAALDPVNGSVGVFFSSNFY